MNSQTASLFGITVSIAVALATPTSSARAANSQADHLTKLFVDACLPHLGDVDSVRAWAEEHHLSEIKAPSALNVFVGAGGEGHAWAAPSGFANFALSIRGHTRGCTVWAQAADPKAVEYDFKSMLAAVRAIPDADLRPDTDTVIDTAAGVVHTLGYNLQSSSPNARQSFEFIMQTTEHENPAFQAFIEVAPATPRRLGPKGP